MNDRPSFGEMKATSNNGGDRWVCKHCGCRHFVEVPSYQQWDVESVYPLKNGNPRRFRICGRCGKDKIRTEETPVPNGFKVVVVPIEEGERDAA